MGSKLGINFPDKLHHILNRPQGGVPATQSRGIPAVDPAGQKDTCRRGGDWAVTHLHSPQPVPGALCDHWGLGRAGQSRRNQR